METWEQPAIDVREDRKPISGYPANTVLYGINGTETRWRVTEPGVLKKMREGELEE